MYYDNKRTFYVKQYGPTALVSVVAVALISVGSVMYFNANKNQDIVASKPEDSQVIEEVETTPEVIDTAVVPETPAEEPVVEPEVIVEEQVALKEVEEVPTVEEVVPYFTELGKLVKSELVKVTAVDDAGNITLESNGDKITVALIGVNYKYSTVETYNKIKSDLENKQVKIAFDSEREANGTKVAYIFLDNELYNATIIKSGLATVKSERTNVALATDLSNAQTYARQNKMGVWNR